MVNIEHGFHSIHVGVTTGSHLLISCPSNPLSFVGVRHVIVNFFSQFSYIAEAGDFFVFNKKLLVFSRSLRQHKTAIGWDFKSAGGMQIRRG